MPNYKFECTVCGCVFTKELSMASNHRIPCKECGKETKKIIGSVNGWVKRSNNPTKLK